MDLPTRGLLPGSPFAATLLALAFLVTTTPPATRTRYTRTPPYLPLLRGDHGTCDARLVAALCLLKFGLFPRMPLHYTFVLPLLPAAFFLYAAFGHMVRLPAVPHADAADCLPFRSGCRAFCRSARSACRLLRTRFAART